MQHLLIYCACAHFEQRALLSLLMEYIFGIEVFFSEVEPFIKLVLRSGVKKILIDDDTHQTMRGQDRALPAPQRGLRPATSLIDRPDPAGARREEVKVILSPAAEARR